MSQSQELDIHRKLPEDLQPLDLYGIIDCDIVLRIPLLDRDLNQNIADSCCSSDRRFRVTQTCRSTQYYLPGDWREPFDVATGVSALDSMSGPVTRFKSCEGLTYFIQQMRKLVSMSRFSSHSHYLSIMSC
jgi:hypothetical protein